VLPAKKPTCPRWLDEEAKKEWRRVCPELARAGTLALVDRGILAGYCSAYSRWRKAEEAISNGDLTELARHGTRARPEVAIARDALTQMRAMAAELGLTPKSRGSVKGQDKPGKPRDALDEALGTGRNN
jgi:P27 family predicted phage terminase small subunit